MKEIKKRIISKYIEYRKYIKFTENSGRACDEDI